MSHRIELAAGWSLWRWACLRGAGFPARLVLDLASADVAAAADRWVERKEEADGLGRELRAAYLAVSGTAGQDEERISRALKRLRQDRVPDPIEGDPTEPLRLRRAASVAAREASAGDLERAHGEAHRAVAARLRLLAADDRLREAILWQNPTAVRTGLESLLRRPPGATDSKTRQYESLVARHLQRYAVKNDTIGFFGPVGWARLVDGPIALVQRPGPSLLDRRTVYFEHWAVDALAARLARDPELRRFAAPRLLPRYRIDGTTLHYPVGRRSELPAEFAAVASRCDGSRRALAIAAELVADPNVDLGDEAEVLELLDELVESRLIAWTFEVPVTGERADDHLAALLEAIEDEGARALAVGALAELRGHRDRVAAATGAAELERALSGLEVAFRAATDAESQRAHGATYAGRTPLYEDCRRDLVVELGRPLLDRLGPPLALVLASARWFTHEIASRYRRALVAIHRRLRADGPVDFAAFWEEVPALFPVGAGPGSIVGEVQAELRRRWAEILAPGGERRIERRAADLADAVERQFAAPCPGWPAARHHSPDVMIAAASAAAVARGDYRLVLGELHTGMNTVMGPLFVKQHPRPAELIAAHDADIEPVCIAPVWSRAVSRADYYSLSPRDVDLESGDTRSARPRSHVVRVADLVLDERDGQVEVATRDGARRFDLIAFVEHHLIAESHGAFSPIAPAARTPRVTIDDLVFARETWRITAAELDWPSIKEPVARFAAARRWARSLGMPRWLFVKTAEEVKPAYVDLDSPIYVEVLAKQLRGASAAALSEMLPAVDETWVEDAAGERYTAELRLAAVDPEPWQPGPDRPGAQP